MVSASKGRAIGRCLDMTRMPGAPREPGVARREDGLVVRVERWTSWIIERPWHDWATLEQWIKGRIDHAEHLVYDRAYAEQFYATMDRFQGYFGDDTVQVVESGVGSPRYIGP